MIDDHLLIRGGGGEGIRLGRTLPIRELSCVHWHLSISEIQCVPYVDVCIDGYLNRQKKARELPLRESLSLLPLSSASQLPSFLFVFRPPEIFLELTLRTPFTPVGYVHDLGENTQGSPCGQGSPSRASNCSTHINLRYVRSLAAL